MATKDYITDYIDRLQVGKIFTADMFVTDTISHNAARMTLERLVQEGRIRKYDRGRYFKPKQSVFGELEPDISQVLNDLIEDKNHRLIGYLTGTIIFSQLGLTTQISSKIEIGVRKYKRSIRRGKYTISFVEQPNSITRENVPLLQLLDAIRFIRTIPAATPDETVRHLLFLIGKLTPEEHKRLVSLALNYKPYVRALLGAILQQLQSDSDNLDRLHHSLNEMTVYRLHLSNALIPTSNWNIL